jgi:hypothetical protein
LLAGLAERENADEKDDAELKLLGARWRPELWLDTVKEPLQTPTRSAVGFGWEICTRPSCQRNDKKSSTTKRASPQGASFDAPKCGSPAPAKRMLRVLNAVTGLGEPHQVLRRR